MGYAVASISKSIVHWDRDSSTGALTNKVALIDTTNLDGAFGVTLSPDGKNIYVGSRLARSIVHWDRDLSTGALTNKVPLIDAYPYLYLWSVGSVVVSPEGKTSMQWPFLPSPSSTGIGTSSRA